MTRLSQCTRQKEHEQGAVDTHLDVSEVFPDTPVTYGYSMLTDHAVSFAHEERVPERLDGVLVQTTEPDVDRVIQILDTRMDHLSNHGVVRTLIDQSNDVHRLQRFFSVGFDQLLQSIPYKRIRWVPDVDLSQSRWLIPVRTTLLHHLHDLSNRWTCYSTRVVQVSPHVTYKELHGIVHDDTMFSVRHLHGIQAIGYEAQIAIQSFSIDVIEIIERDQAIQASVLTQLSQERTRLRSQGVRSRLPCGYSAYSGVNRCGCQHVNRSLSLLRLDKCFAIQKWSYSPPALV